VGIGIEGGTFEAQNAMDELAQAHQAHSNLLRVKMSSKSGDLDEN
jgi:hypothetical protein